MIDRAEHVPSMYKGLASSPSYTPTQYKPGVVAHSCSPSFWEVVTGGSDI